ncbi:glycosyltransferase [Limnobacter sp.]|uniref:glycosyltransferase family 4 protein n=1 Tax=Limnobacter sp. TaxID=2003368 RepID=UPI0025B953A6|nr:glycosyltransferase [Limnobacter sp.]
MKRINITFMWPGLPDYAARALGYLRDEIKEDVKVSVIATKPKVPIQGMELSFGAKIHWYDQTELFELEEMVTNSDYLFVGGYKNIFSPLLKKCDRNNCSIVLMSDNNVSNNLVYEKIRELRFKLLHKRNYRMSFVPGTEGINLMKNWGFKEHEIFSGLYVSDPTVFSSEVPLRKREKSLLYVGQFIERKNVDLLCLAFSELVENYPCWKLTLVGSGDLNLEKYRSKNIEIKSFMQPVEIAKLMRVSKAFILPSKSEHWGLVVLEAALSGCALLLSENVGSKSDLCNEFNSAIYKAQKKDIKVALEGLFNWSDEKYDQAEFWSLENSRKFNPSLFITSVKQIIKI